MSEQEQELLDEARGLLAGGSLGNDGRILVRRLGDGLVRLSDETWCELLALLRSGQGGPEAAALAEKLAETQKAQER